MTENIQTKDEKKLWHSLILHLHPRKVRPYTLNFSLTFGLGGMAALLIVIQILTGLLLKFHYVPSPADAFDSIESINENLLFGRMAHNLHHWSAILLLWIVFFHMLRVLFTGAYQKPRHVTWILGLILMILVVLSNFTGYLLPWDQLSYWAVTVGTSLLQYIPLIGSPIKEALLGGNEVDSATLSNFFNLHTGIIPLTIIFLMAYHFWKIRKAGGVIVPEPEKEKPMVDIIPNLVYREFAVALALIALLLVMSIFFDAPLRERANPSFSPNPAKAPWYFMGIQELLIHFHPFFAIIVFPLLILGSAIWLPYIKKNEPNAGIWFFTYWAKNAGKNAAIAAFLFTVTFILLSEFLPDPETALASIPSIITNGFIPFVIVAGTIFLYLRYLKKKYSINRAEYIQTLIIILVMSYTVLSLTGIFFRGKGMNLVWPWV
jgi:quinol-cytochrome oxidoreductase complex cytochrome b subunit